MENETHLHCRVCVLFRGRTMMIAVVRENRMRERIAEGVFIAFSGYAFGPTFKSCEKQAFIKPKTYRNVSIIVLKLFYRKR